MAYSNDEHINFEAVTETLVSTFGEVLSREAIYSIVDCCSGDLQNSANVIMAVTNENNGRQTHNEILQNTASSEKIGRAVTKKEPINYGTNSTVPLSTKFDTQPNENMTMSYASASTSKHRDPDPRPVDKTKPYLSGPKRGYQTDINIWTDQVRRIVTYHNHNTRTLIIMRGTPGSGKSFLARQIQEITVGSSSRLKHIYSTDDYFITRRGYEYDRSNLGEAHRWNQLRVLRALQNGISPVIVDNTNIEYWEIEPYAKYGVINGYLLEVVEPNTPWARSLNQLVSKNVHGVDSRNIKKMLTTLSTLPITSSSLLTYYKLVYPKDLQPPILCNDPKNITNPDCLASPTQVKFQKQQKSTTCHKNIKRQQDSVFENSPLLGISEDRSINVSYIPANPLNSENETFNSNSFTNKSSYGKVETDINEINQASQENVWDVTGEMNNEYHSNNCVSISNNEVQHKDTSVEFNLHQNSSVVQQPDPINNIEYGKKASGSKDSNIKLGDEKDGFSKSVEEFEKVEKEWDNGEAWDSEIKISHSKELTTKKNDAKPPRHRKNHKGEGSLELFSGINDWKTISMYMPPWTDNNSLQLSTKKVVETKSTETCIEIGDTNISSPKNFKVVSVIARDINVNYMSDGKEKIPEKRMFDKSTMTNEPTSITGVHRCNKEDQHFNIFRNVFKQLNEDDLKDIFDKCCGDVNWAMSIVLDGMDDKQLASNEIDKQSDTGEENYEPCECIANYGIIPHVTPSTLTSETSSNNLFAASASQPSTSNVTRNEFSGGTKKQKQKDSSLSNTSLVLKRQIEQNIVISDHYYSPECLKVRKIRHGELDGDSSPSQTIENLHTPFSLTASDNNDYNSSHAFEVVDNESESDDEAGLNDIEKTVNIDLGQIFLSQLDSIFGRKDMVYTENIQPRVNMPISLLNEINALWMESLMYQLEAQSKQHEDMIKLDEEFARGLAMKQEELCQEVTEPQVPNFKELMDMELALSLYQKDCEEWQKERPTDLASKLSVQKLYNLFPDISHEALDEIHMAHHYDFKTTVGVLLMSSGRGDVVEEENGVNKFIMAEELNRQGKVLAQEKERLLKETQWPALPNQIDLSTVDHYRNEAISHLKLQALSYVNACNFMNRGMKDCANHCTDIAQFHKLKCEQAHNVAAAALMQFHASKAKDEVTIDLHYLRVSEAKEALDIFLDDRIRRLKESNMGRKNFTLYFITGRGLHSRGGPKIKPAIKKRLRERGLICNERNPGLLTSKVCADDKMTRDLA